ncbi:MAG: methionyl-tRNA formyltransferase [Chloroflexi bacterium]|nr:methionyl-tRNA formyltransferase [Chloroflexota bacterium]MDA1239274.1 methionyl-tRNA formyltransferase [Chloroflexota bacterium]
MRIVLFGQAAFGRDVFTALRDGGEEVVGVSVPRQTGRPDPLAEAATEAGVEVIETPALRQDEPFQRYLEWKPDLLVFAFVTDIVRKRVLDAARLGAIQYHPSLLPRHRGRSAINWALLTGATRTGLTIFWVDEGIDTGPVLLQREVEVGPEDTVGSLYFQRLYPLGVEALVESVRLVREGTAPRLAQDETLATYEPPCGPEHVVIDWMQHGEVIANIIRGGDPQPGASARYGGETIRLYGGRYLPGHPEQPPGTVLDIEDGRARIAAIGGAVRIERVQRDGQAKVAAGEILRPGDVLEHG